VSLTHSIGSCLSRRRAGSARQPLSWFEQLFAYGSHAALAVACLASRGRRGRIFRRPSTLLPLKAPSLERLHRKTARSVSSYADGTKNGRGHPALKVDVEALRAAQRPDGEGYGWDRRPEDASRCGENRNRHLDRRACGQGRAHAARTGGQAIPNYPAARSYGRQLATPLAAGSSGAARHRQRRCPENRCTLRRRSRRLMQRTVSEIHN